MLWYSFVPRHFCGDQLLENQLVASGSSYSLCKGSLLMLCKSPTTSGCKWALRKKQCYIQLDWLVHRAPSYKSCLLICYHPYTSGPLQPLQTPWRTPNNQILVSTAQVAKFPIKVGSPLGLLQPLLTLKGKAWSLRHIFLGQRCPKKANWPPIKMETST